MYKCLSRFGGCCELLFHYNYQHTSSVDSLSDCVLATSLILSGVFPLIIINCSLLHIRWYFAGSSLWWLTTAAYAETSSSKASWLLLRRRVAWVVSSVCTAARVSDHIFVYVCWQVTLSCWMSVCLCLVVFVGCWILPWFVRHFVDTFRGLPFDDHQLQLALCSLMLCGVFPLMINDSNCMQGHLQAWRHNCGCAHI